MFLPGNELIEPEGGLQCCRTKQGLNWHFLDSRESRARKSLVDGNNTMGPKWAPFLTLLWAASCATASSRSCGSDRQILKDVEIPAAPCSQFHPFAPPSSNGRLHQPSWRNEKARLRSCTLVPNPTVTRKGATKRRAALEITGSTTRRLRTIKMGC